MLNKFPHEYFIAVKSVAFDSVHTALKKGRFWITPDPYHNDDNIQIGREVKISCQVEATPPEELMFSWLKNGRALRSSERMVITQTDPDVAPGTTNLDIIDLKFTDFGTYTCVASLKNGGIPEISIDVNISSTTGEFFRYFTGIKREAAFTFLAHLLQQKIQ